MGRGKRVEGVLNELPEPTPQQDIVRVTGIPGGNKVNVCDASDRVYSCRVPSKYRNVVWIKMGGYLIVDRLSDDAGDERTEVQGTVAHFLYRDQIRNLQTRGLWPAAFAEGSDVPTEAAGSSYVSELRANPNHYCHGDDLPPSSSDEEEGEEEDGEPEAAESSVPQTT